MVHLVGAGPGDPGLMTVKGMDLLRTADVVVYDRLIGKELLCETRDEAILIDAGKKPGIQNHTKQAWINEMLVLHGRSGKRVVRLKGGDPFVFGRGGEEILALKEAGIPYEVVPGISSSIAAPALAGVPVTHRKVSNGFAVFTAHEAEDSTGEGIPWAAVVHIPTAVFLMGRERLAYVTERLLHFGKSPETPVAVISNASTPRQRVARGTLATISDHLEGIEAPATIVVGEVAGLGLWPEA